MDDGDPLERFKLRELEVLLLEATEIVWMWNDAQLDGKEGSAQYFKRLALQAYATNIGRRLRTDNGDGSPIERLPAAVELAGGDPEAPWLDIVRRAVASNTLLAWVELARDDSVIEGLKRRLTEDERAALMVIELAAFSPWGDNQVLGRHEKEWDKQLRQFLASAPVRAGAEDAARLAQHLRDALKELGRGRVLSKKGKAIVVGIGAVAGAVTGGLAAPFVGGAVGGAMGLGGAAATNAGLALLGGGSLAAGGLGMAGGTAVVATSTAIAGGAGFGLGGLAVRLGTPEEEVAECAKLIVLTEDVVLGIDDDVEMARLILHRLEQRLSQAEAERDATQAPVELGRYSPPTTRRAVVLQRAVTRLRKSVAEAAAHG